MFGMKGGAAGGGMAQVVPMEEINLQFTGDFNAIALANNLLAAMLDNHIHHGNELGIDVRRITWKRVMDMNDRALRDITVALGGPGQRLPAARTDSISWWHRRSWPFSASPPVSKTSRPPRQHRRRVYTRHKPVWARDLKAAGAMTVLLREALKPNLVQTLENNPAFVQAARLRTLRTAATRCSRRRPR